MPHFPAAPVPRIYRTYNPGVHGAGTENAGREEHLDRMAGRARTGIMSVDKVE